MKQLVPLLGIIGLGLTVIPSVLVFIDLISIDLNKILMLLGTILWFLVAPFWFSKTRHEKE